MVLVFLALLAAAQYLALFFFYSAVPTILRQAGAPLEMLGFFGLAYAAFSLSFLWAPFVDRFHLPGLGRRRTWLIGMQLAALVCVGLAAGLDPARDLLALLAIAILASLAAATQRIATLGYAVETLRPRDRAWGSTAIGWGGALGLLVGGSAMLVAVERGGWSLACGLLAGLLALAVLLLPLLPEPRPKPPSAARRPSLAVLLRRPEIRRGLAVALPLAFAKGIAFTLLQPRLVDLGIGLSEIALVVGLANAAGFTLVGPAVSALLPRISLARGFDLMTLCSTAALALIAVPELTGLVSVPIGVAAALLLFAAFTVMQVVVSTVFMTLSDEGQAGTDLTTLLSLFALGAIPGMVAAGFIAGAFGYSAGFATAAASCLGAFLIARAAPLARDAGSSKETAERRTASVKPT